VRDPEATRRARWRLVLGAASEPALGAPTGEAAGVDRALTALYDEGKKGRLGPSQPSVARWLGDIRAYFPSSVVTMLQRDALDRLELTALVLEPETLRTLEPDVHLAATLVSLAHLMPERTRETARMVVREVVRRVEAKLAARTLTAARGALSRAARTRRPRAADVDWVRTIRANLGRWVPARRALVPERLVGRARRRATLRELHLLVDQSASMATSIVYASVLAATLASLPAVRVELAAFDTALVDLTPLVRDPVDVLFGCQLGGGTDIGAALAWVEGRVRRPRDATVVLVSDLFDGGAADRVVRRAASLLARGVRLVVLLALSDDGTPAHDVERAARLAALGVPCLACTPDRFPELVADLLA
jgi:hypothetical protein